MKIEVASVITTTSGSSGSSRLLRARTFLRAAEKLANDSEPFAPVVTYLIWHASELALKALIGRHNDIRDHELNKVLNHLKASNSLDPVAYTLLETMVRTVTGSGTEKYGELRYPPENQLCWEKLLPEETRIRLDAAKTIIEICQARFDHASN